MRRRDRSKIGDRLAVHAAVDQLLGVSHARDARLAGAVERKQILEAEHAALGGRIRAHAANAHRRVVARVRIAARLAVGGAARIDER